MKFRQATLILLASVFFLAGVLSVFVRPPGPAGDPTPQPAEPTAEAGSGTGRTTMLVLGVDALSAPDPGLRAVWIISFRPAEPRPLFLGVSPAAAPDNQAGRSLAELFSYSPGKGLEPGMLAAVQQVVPLEFQAVMILDEVAFAYLVDYLGGVVVNDRPVSGEQILWTMRLLYDDHPALLEAQRTVLRAMIDRGASLGAAPDLSPLLDLIPDHAYLSAPAAQAAVLLSPLLPVRPEHFQIDLLDR
jgi:hypothetical protein